MIPPERTVALVGRPNVGKSRLFNRLARKRIAIVHDQPGVTRDLASAEIERQYTLLDTGGIGMKPEMTPQMIHDATEEQVGFAITAASVVLFVVDGIEGLSAIDRELAEQFRTSGKQVLLVVNKMDKPSAQKKFNDFYELGFGDPIAVSAEHGSGADELHAAILDKLGPYRPPWHDKEAKQRRTRICLCGRPNVGKSSLGNALIQAPRLIVSEVAGTTRDAIELDLDFDAGDDETWHFRLMDTAGVKPRRKLGSSLDYFSGLRTTSAIERSDVALMVLDALNGVTKHDKTLAGEILEAGKGLVIVVNKWDLAMEKFRSEPLRGYDTEAEFRKVFEEAVRKELFFLPNSPLLFVSAKSGFQIETLLQQARELDKRMEQILPTGALNSTLRKLFDAKTARVVGGRRFKAYYATQVSNRPFKFRLFCNRAEQLEDGYRRFLESGLRKAFDLRGCPLVFELVGKPKDNPYYEPIAAGKDKRAVNTLSKHGKAKAQEQKRRR